MSHLIVAFAQLIAKYATVSIKSIEEISIVESYGYSKAFFDEIGSAITPSEIDELKQTKNAIGTNEFDSIFLCNVLMQGRNYIVLIYDSEDLYAPTWVWGMFPR
ncbi:hypothetical protein IDJ77_06950 [Mucilaginibacter sp. ZT4R22]|uniref:Uncharacterized protein n=1 Tax=Mucilaginibacter pankratovii TaxID=2772110 RepID=A0ABR7WQL0_9SPHI|nr:hypothetical protein [Mucilaginibacter pankratovii]MBD1363542.1 hypothetical protein [Mucilaginibacter pankratovii]